MLNFIFPSERRHVTRGWTGRLHYRVCWASHCTQDSGPPLSFSSWVFLFCGSCGEVRLQDSTCHQNPAQTEKPRPDQNTYVQRVIVAHGLSVHEQQFAFTESLNASGDGIAHCHDHQPHSQEYDTNRKSDLRVNKRVFFILLHYKLVQLTFTTVVNHSHHFSRASNLFMSIKQNNHANWQPGLIV